MFQSHTLPSGLRIVAETDSRAYSAAYGFFVRAGSRDERDPQSGLSHFLEHMMFKGTARRSAADVNRELDELGGQSNAYTSEEQTVYYATVLPKFQSRIVDLLGDMLNPTLDEGEFETERQVILEEIAKYEDQPPFGAFERSMEVHFGPRGVGRRVLGTSESIRDVSVDQMRDYFSSRYRCENIVVAATGNVDFQALIDQIAEVSSNWCTRQANSNLNEDDSESLPPGIALEHQLTVPELNQAYVVRLSDGPSTKAEDRYPTRALAAILGDEGGSRLFWELIDTGRAEVATVWPQEFMDCGGWFSYLVCDPSDVDSNLRLMDDTLAEVATGGVRQEELDQTINKAVAAAIMQSERPGNRLFGLGSRYLIKNEYQSLDDSIEKIRAIQVDDVSAAAQKYLGQPKTEIRVTAG